MSSVERYRIQRQQRQQQRKHQLSKIQNILRNIKSPPKLNPVPEPIHSQQEILIHPYISQQQQTIIQQNKQLNEQFRKLQEQEQEKSIKHKQKLLQAQQLYSKKIRDINQAGLQERKQTQLLINRMENNIETVLEENYQIEEDNLRVEQQFRTNQKDIDLYLRKKQEEDEEMLLQFGLMLEASTEGIDFMAERQQAFSNKDIDLIVESASRKSSQIDNLLDHHLKILHNRESLAQQLSQSLSKKYSDLQQMKEIYVKMNNFVKILQEEIRTERFQYQQSKEMLINWDLNRLN